MSDRVTLTALYVPADRPDRFDRAARSGADVVILDLEDGVAPAAKADARRSVDEWLRARTSGADRPTVQVRVNRTAGPWGAADLELLAPHTASVSVRLPKVESSGDLDAVRAALGPVDVHALIETALGVERAYTIASHPAVRTIALGDADLASDLGLTDDTGLTWARSRTVIAARSAGLPAPMMAAYTRLSDDDGLTASCRAGRALGFVGRTAIHPAQLRPIVEAFRPSAAEVEQAHAVVDALAAAQTDGAGVTVLPSGAMLDAAMLGRAEAVLDRESSASAALALIDGR